MNVKRFFETEYQQYYNEEPWLIKDSHGCPILQVAHRDNRYFVLDSHGDMGLDEPEADVAQIATEWLESAFSGDEEGLAEIVLHRIIQDIKPEV